MAVYKVVDTEKLNADLSDVANAIRTKAETSGGLVFPEGFMSAVNGIQKGIIPTDTKNITQNGSFDVTAFAEALVNVPAYFPNNTIHYFNLSSNKTGSSTLSNSWYSFTPDFTPRIIMFNQTAYANRVTRISNIYTVVASWWIDTTYSGIQYTGASRKSVFIHPNLDATEVSNGTSIAYDKNTNKIYFECSSSSYGLAKGSVSSGNGFYSIQYWG